MKKTYFNIINICLFAIIICIVCCAYFLLCDKNSISLVCFIFCDIALVLGLALQLITHNSKSIHGALSVIGGITASGIYIISTAALWLLSPLFYSNAHMLLFIQIVVLVIYLAVAIAIIAFSHHQNQTEQEEEINLQTYMLCSNILRDISSADIDTAISKRILNISDQLKFIKSSTFCANDEIVGKVLSIKKLIKGGVNDKALSEEIFLLEKTVEQHAVNIKQ